MDKLIINFTPTGMVPTKDQTPHVPVSCDEIVEDVRKAYELGITIVHLHARDQVTGAPCYKKETYGEMIKGIRSFAPDLVICASTSGRIFNEFEKRSEVLQLEGEMKPDMGSLTLASLNFPKQASVNAPDMVSKLAQEMDKRGIKPELESFDTGMTNYAKYLIKKGILKPPYYFNIILGNIASAQANLHHTSVMINDIPEDSTISLGGIGNYQTYMNSLAVSTGYGVRVGLEDNIWYDGGRTKLASNIDMIKRIRNIAEANEREVMSPSEFRERLNLKPGFGEYGTK